LSASSGKSYGLLAKVAIFLFITMFLICVVLCFVVVFSSVQLTKEKSISFWFVFSALNAYTFIFFANFISAHEINKNGGGGVTVFTFIAFAVIYYVAVFYGAPKLLHYSTSTPQELIATVVEKQDRRKKHFCRPRFVVALHKNSQNVIVCPNQGFYENSSIGSIVRVSGEYSNFGFYAESVTGQ
jgi:hypothetical protein